MIFGLPWRLVGIFLILAAILGIGFFLRHSGYEAGIKETNAKWEALLAASERRVQQAQQTRDAVIARAAQDAALRRQQISILLDRGHHEIEAATPSIEAPLDAGLSAAWASAIDRLCIYPAGADGDVADSCRANASR